MILAFRMGPVASGLFDIDGVFFKVAKSRVKKLESPCRTEIYRKQKYTEKTKLMVHFTVNFPIFDT